MITSVKLMLNKDRKLNNGNYPLVFQVIHNRRKKLLYTGCRIREEIFDATNEVVIDGGQSFFRSTEIAEINQKIKRMRRRINMRIRQLQQSGNDFVVEDVLADYVRKQPQFYLLQYIDMQIERKRRLKREGMVAAYRSTRSSLVKFLMNKDIEMTELSVHFVQGYEDFLFSSGVTANTVSYYLRNFRALYNQAIVDGFHPRVEYPFIKAPTRPCKTVKRALSRKDMQALAKLQFEGQPELEFARDIYLFSFYSQGMAFVDIVFLKKSDIRDGILTYSRHKSKQLIHIMVTTQMKAMIDKYQSSGEYIFPILNRVESAGYRRYRLALGRVNRYLKKISLILGTDISLTTYTARHTWATLARDYGAPVSVISAGLGHTSEEMTRIYLKEFDMSLLDRINSAVTDLTSDGKC